MRYRTQLLNALDKNEFELHYQPLISLEKNLIIEFEALIRWRHPELGLVFPDKFIRYAEKSGFIVPICYWVIGLLGYWVIGLLGYWVTGLLGYWVTGLLKMYVGKLKNGSRWVLLLNGLR
jgi:EAL domain-containing protein